MHQTETLLQMPSTWTQGPRLPNPKPHYQGNGCYTCRNQTSGTCSPGTPSAQPSEEAPADPVDPVATIRRLMAQMNTTQKEEFLADIEKEGF